MAGIFKERSFANIKTEIRITNAYSYIYFEECGFRKEAVSQAKKNFGTYSQKIADEVLDQMQYRMEVGTLM
jgi:hypothetical protein